MQLSAVGTFSINNIVISAITNQSINESMFRSLNKFPFLSATQLLIAEQTND
jgi:hypothetical protein